jgi:hypothetical protein
MHSSAQTTQSAAWPEGVVARYLTVGEALVDVTRSINPDDEKASRWDWTRATCAGCDQTDGADWNTRPYTQVITVSQAEKIATREVRKWAQAHAEKCRALPRPTA